MPKRYWLNQLNTADLDRLVSFYTRIFGFVEDEGFREIPGVAPYPTSVLDVLGLAPGPERSIMLRIPGDKVRLEVFEWPADRYEERSRAFNGGGLVRLGLLTDDVDAEVAKIRAENIEVIYDGVVSQLNWGHIRYAFVRDPDGNLVELFQGDVENN
jgi:catechol 2,3-dioxygenase-like lactoylglutathione lyase family enzyme